MSRRLLILFVLSIVIVALSGPVLAEGRVGLQPLTRVWDPPPAMDPPDDQDDGDNGLGFGKKIAGAWLGTGQFVLDLGCDGVPDGEPVQYPWDSHSFTASGFWLATQPNDPLPGHGTWKKTGPQEITADSIVYSKNPETGALEWIMRIPAVFTFNNDFTTATSTFGAVGYFPDQDPLDPQEVPAWCTIGQHHELRKVPPSQ